jgi:phosphate-selective porin OprO and OprP
MKRIYCSLLMYLLVVIGVRTQTTNDILNLLIQDKLISQKMADSVRAAAAITEQENLAKQKLFPVNAGKKLQLAGYTQVRYQILDEPGKIDGFDIRRARLDLKGNFSPYWGYRLQADFANSPKLLDAYVELKIKDYLNFTVGQDKIPFSLENITADNKLEFIERSQVVDALVARKKDVIFDQNGRDIGIQLGGNFLKINNRSLIDYKFGVFNGSGIDSTVIKVDKNENKDLAGRLIFHPISGLDIGGSYYNGVVNIGDSINRGRTRYGFELAYEWKDLSLRSEYIHGTDPNTKSPAKDEINKEGFYAQAGYYFFKKKIELVGKYDYFKSNIAKTNTNSNWYILGVNVNFNANCRLQVNYTFKEEEGPDKVNNAASFQLQIGF